TQAPAPLLALRAELAPPLLEPRARLRRTAARTQVRIRSGRRRTTGGQGLEPRSRGPKPRILASWTTPQRGSSRARYYDATRARAHGRDHRRGGRNAHALRP